MNTSSSNTDRIQRLRGWFDTLITKFRLETEELTHSEKARISNEHRYFSPCQIEVIWIEDPEYQIVINSNFPQRRDKEIFISGPVKAYELVEVLDSVLKESRWSQQFTSDKAWVAGEGAQTSLSEVLSGIFGSFMESIEQDTFRRVGKNSMRGTMLVPEVFVWLVTGNIADMNQEEMLAVAMSQAKHNPAVSQKESRLQSSAAVPLRLKCKASFFYPPINIGPLPKPESFRDYISGTYRRALSEQAYAGSFGNLQILVSRDGLVHLTIDSKEDALRIFNTIFGTALLNGIGATAARESDVGDAEIDPSNFNTAGYSFPAFTQRANLFKERNPIDYSHPTMHIPWWVTLSQKVSVEQIADIITKAERIFKQADKADQLIILVEAYSHFRDSEYAPSFTLSWIIIEKHLSQLWMGFLLNSGITNRRRLRKLSRNWQIDNRLEGLNLTKVLGAEDYATLMELKDKRNRFIHDGTPITKIDAGKCLDFAHSIIWRDLQESVGSLP